jgi:hypothetical protein
MQVMELMTLAIAEMHGRDARRLKSGATLGPSKELPDDLCDLPNSGCESLTTVPRQDFFESGE